MAVAWNKGLTGFRTKGSFKKGQTPWNKGKHYKDLLGEEKAKEYVTKIWDTRGRGYSKHTERYYRDIARKNIPYICVKCGRKNMLDIHHKDGDHKNNELSNLEFLCRKCHRNTHGVSKNVRIATTKRNKTESMRLIHMKYAKNALRDGHGRFMEQNVTKV